MTEKPNGKPTYQVPSMEEIKAIEWNGLNVASTFSGCGGSCLGYCMAGFRVLWANEFHGPARESYELNHDTPIDERDIRDVKPKDVLEALNMEPGELDVFDGSPPCQGFSTAGKREVSDTRNNLFFEYTRLLKGIKPKAFIAENVSGMVKGTMKGIFIKVLRELKACGYRVRCKVLDAQWLGVPQMRRRVIFVGFRNDLEIEPTFPKPLAYRYSVRDALPWIMSQPANDIYKDSIAEMKGTDEPSRTINAGAAGTGSRCKSRVLPNGTFPPSLVESETDISRYAIGKEWKKLRPGQQSDKYFQLVRADPEKPCNTILQTSVPSIASVCHPTEERKFSIAELKRIGSFPDDFQLSGSYAQQWARIGNSVPPLMAKAIAEVVRDQLHSI